MNSIAGFEQSQHVRILILSDSHNNRNAVHRILQQHESQCDAAVFCGDGARDFLSQVTLPCAAVRGNNDSSLCHIHAGTTARTETLNAVEWLVVCGRRIMLTHGHLFYDTERLLLTAQEQQADIVLYGHTHVAQARWHQNLLLLNPGSCSLPREGQLPGFCILSLAMGKTPEYQFYALSATGKSSFYMFSDRANP